MEIESRVKEELANMHSENVVFDYIYREVSAKSGEGVKEALQLFSENLFDFYKEKKKRKKV